jgi:hypothetical protein
MPKNDNTLVIPDGLIAAVDRLLDSDKAAGVSVRSSVMTRRS